MKELKKDLQAITKALKQLTRKTEQMAKKLDKLEKAPVAKKLKAKKVVKAKPVKRFTMKKRAKPTASDIVLKIIHRSRKGVDLATLQEKTAFNNQKIRDNIYKLTKRGRIKRLGRGIYIAA